MSHKVERTIIMFPFTDPQPKETDLDEWKKWFALKGIYTEVAKGRSGYTLLVAGEGVDNKGRACPEPKVTQCKFCGKDPPHSINHFKYCDDMCMHADYRRKKYEGL